MDTLNQLQEKYKNTHDISQKLYTLKQLFEASKDNKEFNNYKKQFDQLKKEFNSSNTKNKGYLSDLNIQIDNLFQKINIELNSSNKKNIGLISRMNEILKSIGLYSIYALNEFNNIGVRAAPISQNIKHIDVLPEINVFIRRNNAGAISLTALNDNQLDHDLYGTSLKEIFESLGSNYITDDLSFDTNGGYSGSVKVDSSVHNGILSVILIFPQKIQYSNTESTQIIQFLGKIANGVFHPYKYQNDNRVVCKFNGVGGNVDRCFLDNLNINSIPSDLIVDYQHQVVLNNSFISTIHSYKNNRNIAYVDGYKRGIVENTLERDTKNVFSFASNSTGVLPEISFSNNQVIINIGNKERCYDFLLNEAGCVEISTTKNNEVTSSATGSSGSSKTTLSTIQTTRRSSSSSTLSKLTSIPISTNALPTITQALTTHSDSNSTSNATSTNNHQKAINSTNIILSTVIPFIGIALIGYYIYSKIRNQKNNTIESEHINEYDLELNSIATTEERISQNSDDNVFDLVSHQNQKSNSIDKAKAASQFSLDETRKSFTSNNNDDTNHKINLMIIQNKRDGCSNINHENKKIQIQNQKKDKITQNAQNRKTLFATKKGQDNYSYPTDNIELSIAKNLKEDQEKMMKENEEHQILITNLIEALQERMKLKSGDAATTLVLPSCENMMGRNLNRFKKYFSKKGEKFDENKLSKFLFVTESDCCDDEDKLEKLFNDAYRIENQRVAKNKVEIIDDLHVMLLDKTNKWYKTDIFKNNTEEKLLLVLNDVKEKLSYKEKKLKEPLNTEQIFGESTI